MPCTANTLRCLVRDMRHQRGFASKIGQDLLFQGHLHSPQPKTHEGLLFFSFGIHLWDGDTRSRLRCSLGQMFTPAQPNTFLGLKWWTRFTVARPILLPTHQPTAWWHPFLPQVIIASSSWDATGNYFQCSLPLFPMETQWIWRIIIWVLPVYDLTSLRLLQQMEHENGIEPSTSSMARTRSDQLSYSRKKWSVWWEPNPRNQLGRLTLYRWVTDALKFCSYWIRTNSPWVRVKYTTNYIKEH